MEIGKNTEQFIEKCRPYDEMPHSFDDTLFDKFIEVYFMEFDEGMLRTIEQLVREIDFETRSVPIQVVIRLVEAAVKKEVFPKIYLLDEFVNSSQILLTQQLRPLKLINDLLVLYTNSTIFNLKKAEEWLNVIHWGLSSIDEPSTSCFIRRQLVAFLSNLNSKDARRLMVISGILQIFNKRSKIENRDEQIIDATTRLLRHFRDELVAEECTNIVETVRNSQRVGENTIRLIVELQKATTTATIVPLEAFKWKSEMNRVDFVVFFLESDDFVSNEQTMMESILDSPAFKISHQVSLCHRLSDEQIPTIFRIILKRIEATGRKMSLLKDISELIRKLRDRLEPRQISEILKSLGESILDTSLVLRVIFEEFGSEIFEEKDYEDYGEMLSSYIQNGLSSGEAEKIEACLEAGRMFPQFLPMISVIKRFITEFESAPYLTLTCLRILQEHFGGVPIEMAIKIALTSPDAAPKHYAIQLVVELAEEVSDELLYKIIENCLEDIDEKQKLDAINLAKIGLKRPELKAKLLYLLKDYENDKSIGNEIRRLIGKPERISKNDPIHILSEMISSLQFHENEDDTIDCY